MQDEEIAAILRKAGHKVTPQRLMIIRALREAEGHVSAAQIAEHVQSIYPVVDLSTVYRTLDVMKRLKVATAIDLGTGDWLYEWSPPEPHHHLVCTECEEMQELEHSFLAQLEQRLLVERGFEASLDHFAIFGTCNACRAGVDNAHEA